MTAAELAAALGGVVHGDPSREVTGAAGLADATPRDLSFLADARHRAAFGRSRAGVVLVPADAAAALAREPRDGDGAPAPTLLGVDAPLVSFARAASLLRLTEPLSAALPPEGGIHPTAVVGRGASLGDGVALGPYVVIGDGARIGPRTRVDAGAVIGAAALVGADCSIGARAVLLPAVRMGDRVIVHPGAVLGGDGFGFVRDGDAHRKLPQTGRLVVEDDVEIGANTTIDRASSGETRVGRGTKIDNLVQVGHNVRIGERCLLAGQAGIAGSSTLDADVALGGQAGVADHVHLGRGAAAAAQAGIVTDVPDGTVVSGYPALPHALARRVYAARKRLPEVLARLRVLEETVQRLESAARRLAEQGRG